MINQIRAGLRIRWGRVIRQLKIVFGQPVPKGEQTQKRKWEKCKCRQGKVRTTSNARHVILIIKQ